MLLFAYKIHGSDIITTAAEAEQKMNTNTEEASKSTTAAIKHSANIPNPTYRDTTSTTTTITTTKTTDLLAGTMYLMEDGNISRPLLHIL